MVSLLPCYRMMKQGNVSKRSKGFEFCEFWFQLAFYNFNAVLYVQG